MNTIQQELDKLLFLRKTIRLALPLCIIGFLLAGLLGVATQLALPASLLIVAVLAAYLWFTHRQRGQYAEVLDRSMMEHGLCQPLTEVQYLGKDGISREQFTDLAILPIIDDKKALLCHHAFTGQWSGLPLTGQEVTFHYPVVKGGKRTSYLFVNGTLMTAALDPNAQRGDWLVLHSEIVDSETLALFLEINGYHPAQAPEPLGETFVCYSRHPGETLPEELAHRLLKLDKECRNLGAVRLTAERAAVFLNRRFYTGAGYSKTAPTEEMLRRNTLPERDEILHFFRFWASC